MVLDQRKQLPRIGGRKLYYLLKPELQQYNIKCGRDGLFTLLRESALLIPARKRYIQTTQSKHWMRKYPNLFRETKLTGPEQAWVSDITYIRTEEGFCYLNLITDAYSRKIMGYSIADNMEAAQSVKALRMALLAREYPHTSLIHHSDRGLQYCSREYVALATGQGLQMSMTENGDPYENALAERMNRTIKEEFLLDHTVKSKQLAILAAKEAVTLYNERRPHQALGWKTPNQVHTNQ